MSVDKPIEFETDRLRLRQWRDSDAQPFAALSADARVMEYFPSVLTREQSDALAKKYRLFIEQHGWGFWAVELKVGDPFIGFVGLSMPTSVLPFSPCVEIGWRLAQPHWGQGYATEAAIAALAIGFEQLQLSEIVSFAVEGNGPSRRVMERIGLKHRGEFFDHPSVPEPSPLRRHVLYRLPREQWNTMKHEPGHTGKAS